MCNSEFFYFFLWFSVLQRRQNFKCVMHGFLLGILLSMRLNTPLCGFRLYLLIHVWLVAMLLISIRKRSVPIGCVVRLVSGELASTLLKLSYYNCYLYFLLPLSWGKWWRSWLRHCSTSRKVAGSIPDGVIGFFFIDITLPAAL